jgi:hypothetical protein
MPDDESTFEPTPDLSELEDRPSETPPMVVESDEVVAPSELPPTPEGAPADEPALDASVAVNEVAPSARRTDPAPRARTDRAATLPVPTPAVSLVDQTRLELVIRSAPRP